MDGATVVGSLRFQNWPVVGVKSLAFRFEPEDSRTGIYILSFANGERYVGKSLNVVIRFSTHRRRWDDITHLSFRPFLAEELDLREREVLASVEQRGYRVRNLDLAGRPGGDSLLNIVMEEQAQAEWLESDASEPFDAPRYIAAARRVAGLAHFQELGSRSDFPELLAATANYVATALPWLSQTEGRFWTATAMASTGRSSTWRRLIAIGDVYNLGFTGLQTLSFLLQEGNPIAQPAKELALNLMRKGPSMYTRFHNDHLAGAIFNQIATQDRNQC